MSLKRPAGPVTGAGRGDTGREQSSNQPQQVLENVYCIWFPGGSTDRIERDGLLHFSEKPPGQIQSPYPRLDLITLIPYPHPKQELKRLVAIA